MGLPRITFNGKNIDFVRPPVEFPILPIRTRLRNYSASGRCETLNVESGYSIRAVFTGLRNSDATEGDLKTALFELSQWAEDGRTWTFTSDSAITVNTTLSAAVLAGATSIPVTSATGIVSGRRYVIETLTEIATVEASNTATSPVTITSSLNYGFTSGARFRAFEFIPMLGSVRVLEGRIGMLYDVEITGLVDKNALTV